MTLLIVLGYVLVAVLSARVFLKWQATDPWAYGLGGETVFLWIFASVVWPVGWISYGLVRLTEFSEKRPERAYRWAYRFIGVKEDEK